MSIRHQLKDSDTVEHLANEYLGDAERWREIVDYNNLIYPYLSSNPEDKYRVYADGFVRVTRTAKTQPLTIQKYWTLKTRKNIMGSTIKTYYVVNSVTMAAGEGEAIVYVRSTVPGIQGNAPIGMLTELGDDFIRNSVVVDVYNDNPISGGSEGFVKVTGEYVFIPSEDDSLILETYGTTFSYDRIRYFYGDDLKVELDDLVIGSSEDLSTVSFVENVKQAINIRFTTEAGDMLSDFSFGNRLSEIIGDNNLPFEAKTRLARIEIMECLLEEDRIDEPEITNLILVPAERACYVDLTMKVVKLGTDLELTNIRLGGTE